jgi:hypothetical protein
MILGGCSQLQPWSNSQTEQIKHASHELHKFVQSKQQFLLYLQRFISIDIQWCSLEHSLETMGLKDKTKATMTHSKRHQDLAVG